jgi:hypothetical protein
VKRTEVAVVGAPSTEVLRLEVVGSPSDDGLVLEFLHDERETGSLARVIAGRAGLGEVSVPVAVKLQRDNALSQEDRGSVAAKFDKERNVHRRLQSGESSGVRVPGSSAGAATGAGPLASAQASARAGRERIVRQLEIWPSRTEHEADCLEPSILCARAHHALAPRCPECQDRAAVLEELELTDDRGLRCTRCQRQFWSTPKTREGILEATLRHDPACQGCPHQHDARPDACKHAAVFLNFFRNRVLVLERLDLDLDDYLRWSQQGSAKAGSMVTPGQQRRASAREAFEQHRALLLQRQEAWPGLSVAKTAELLRVTDLFADILAGVEHLHQHDIAHLDLKPANICVNFRGADLEIKIIDLGLSDDPNTLAYLRQAEGPLSLWTDYSAPEFRRPRSRPLQVSGCFREDTCELNLPDLEAPVPGDLLFVDKVETWWQRFRVIHVATGSDGRVVVKAEAEPHYRPWHGEVRSLSVWDADGVVPSNVEVVLEKHCGFPADVYSLGMLLLAVLVGSPDVSAFREALPSVQIELEEQLGAERALPGRALVQRLLLQSSKHLQVFQSYAHRLAAYGLSQPLAEELLGIVLRATLRGDPQVFYLPHRGADARPALERLRQDIDAVRRALRNALAAAQAAAVQENRVAVLNQLRARLHHGSVGTCLPSRPHPVGRFLFPALDLGAAGDSYCEREFLYLSPLAGQPGSVLGHWECELAGSVAKHSATNGTQSFLLRYCRRLDLNSSATTEFLSNYHRLIDTVVRAPKSTEVAYGDDRERALLWIDDHQTLTGRLEYGSTFVKRFHHFLAALEEKLLTPWDRALRVRHFLAFQRRAVRVPLNRGERSAIPDMSAAMEQLVATIELASSARRERCEDFERALIQWRTWCAGRAWLGAFARLEPEAFGQRETLEAASDLWTQRCLNIVSCLQQFLTHISGILSLYDPLLAGKQSPAELMILLTRAQRQALDVDAARDALAWLSENWPSPSDRVEAAMALWELDSGSPASSLAKPGAD